MWELDHKGWALTNWCFRTVVLEKTLESPFESEEIKPVNSKGNQPWIFIRRTDTEAEAPIHWSPDIKSWLIGKVPDAQKTWGPEERRVTEDETVGWHHWLNGHGFEQTQGNGEEQGSLACLSLLVVSMRLQRVGQNWVSEQQCYLEYLEGNPVTNDLLMFAPI